MCCAVVAALWSVSLFGESEAERVGLALAELGVVCVLTPRLSPGLPDLI